jgi:hypothetical protein
MHFGVLCCPRIRIFEAKNTFLTGLSIRWLRVRAPSRSLKISQRNAFFPATWPEARNQCYWGLVAGMEWSFQPRTTESDADSK